LGVPAQTRQMAMLAAQWHTHIHRFRHLKATTKLKLFEALDAFRRPERLDMLVQVCTADVRGRLGFEERAYAQAESARIALQTAAAIDARHLVAQGLRGPAVGEALRRERLAAIAKAHRRQ